MDIAGILPKGVEGDAHNRLCPCHDDRKASLSINPGRFVRVIWHCQAGCSETDVRAALLDLAVDPACLGTYGTPRRVIAPGMRTGRDDLPLIADAKRWHAVLKLPRDLNGKLRQMCIQAIAEGDGDLPGDPVRLLPSDRDGFCALAARAGIGPKYRYQPYRQWAQSIAA